MASAKNVITDLLATADVRINGNRPWDIKVHDERFYTSVIRNGSLAFGESYMAGWWDAEKLDEVVDHILSPKLEEQAKITPATISLYLRSLIKNTASPSRAFEVGKKHYDIGNDLFKLMLDKRMVYTCAYWKDAKNVDEAQEAKLDLVCRKIGLKKGQHVLDIGCGWGSFAKFAAEKYGARVTGVTVSKEQIELGKKLCAGLPVEFRLEDYRDIKGSYDHIVSLGMFEHVGIKNYHAYMKVAHECLKDDGLFLLHTIGYPTSGINNEPWIEKYIFPNGMLPSIAQIGKAIEKKFIMEDWHNFGADYDKTLMAWFENFDRHWPEIKNEYGDTFYRMWKYYLLACAGSFRARKNQLWQIVLSKDGVRGGYTSVR